MTNPIIYLTIFLFFTLAFILVYLIKTPKKRYFDLKPHVANEQLTARAIELAHDWRLTGGRSGINNLLRRVKENYRVICGTYRALLAKQEEVSGAGEWLLDNFYIIEEQYRELGLNKKENAKLPTLKNGLYAGLPRVFAISLEITNRTNCKVTEDAIIEFISAYQTVSYLTDMELWSLSLMLRIALIENIRDCCHYINRAQAQTDEAELKAEEILREPSAIAELISQKLKLGAAENVAFFEKLLRTLKRKGKSGAATLSQIDAELQNHNTTAEAIVALERYNQTTRQLSMGNAIISLKSVFHIDYKEIFNQLSEIEKILNEDPAGVYPKMDLPSKKYYRKKVESISKKQDISEIEAARRALKSAQAASGERERHIGYYLLDRDINPTKQANFGKRQLPYLRAKVFTFLQLLLTVASSAALCWLASTLTQNIAILAAVFFLSLIPASDIVISLINYVITKTTPIRFIPRFEESDAPTFAVIASLLPKPETAHELVTKLETYYLANKLPNLFFGLLTDFPDSKEQETQADKETLQAVQNAVAALNEKYGARFYLFHRKRTLNSKDGIYMGWERKRGAIHELVKLMRGENDHTFIANPTLNNLKLLPTIKYIITLDADTKLPMNSAMQLIGAMEHPLNRPIIKNGRVASGYGLLQPHVVIDIESANISRFSKVFAGVGGIDAYSAAISDVYQDLYGQGIFTGKGIFDIDSYAAVLGNAIPDNKVLSHDLLEGCYLRAGLISDVEFIDGFPARYNSYSARNHRWLRGDWQIIPWLRSKVRNRFGSKTENPITALGKWQILDNMRRSLLPISTIAFIFTSFALLPEHQGTWLTFAIIACCITLLISLFDWMANAGYRFLGQKCQAPVIFGIKGVLYKVVLQFISLPHNALNSLSAIWLAFWRSVFTKRNMLQWITAAQAEEQRSGNMLSYYRVMFINIITAAALFYLNPNIYSVIIGVLWFVAPAVMCFVSKPIKKPDDKLSALEYKDLRALAAETWSFFEHFMTARTHYLVPDNYQEEPPNGSADRTSPTNIGLQLLAVVAACDLGFIRKEKMVELIDKTVVSIEKMEKWHGHLINWYETKTLSVMRPRYVSTVDSGNFAGYLITAAEAVKDCGEKGRLLAQRLWKLFDETDFSCLYDKKLCLFSIGYSIEEEKLTNSFYDILASENRQASFVAIAKGDVPKKHWFTLGRALVSREGYRGLISWTGTMFEYLMPLLIMKNTKNTLLDETYNFVLRLQKKYGKQRDVPWGTSESGFFAFDGQLNYQYKAFGVPDLGLKRGLITEMVVAPYATVMALMVNPRDAMDNINLLNSLKLRGRYGFYEAVDYTPGRVMGDGRYSVVKSYMVHHLGMSLLALDNLLNNFIMQERFCNIPIIRAAMELLSERVPTNVIISKENKEKVEPFRLQTSSVTPYSNMIKKVSPTSLNVHALGTLRYSLVLTDSGLGYAKSGDIMVTRWRGDYITNLYGNFIYVKNVTKNEWWSTTLFPAMRDDCQYSAIFTSDKAEYRKAGGDNIDSITEITTEDNASITRLTLANHTDEPVILEVVSYAEVVLSSFGADISHPAFNNLFIRTEFNEQYNALFASRKPRTEHEPIRYAMHAAYVNSDIIGGVEYDSDRAKFIGRGNNIHNPAAMSESSGKTSGSVLDPIFSLRVKVKLEQGSSAVLNFITAYSENKEELAELAVKYQDSANTDKAFTLAASRCNVENKYLNIGGELTKTAFSILKPMMFVTPARRALAPYISANVLGQQNLWKFGISGDNPIATFVMEKETPLQNVEDLLIVHELWRMKGIKADLIIICKDESGYLKEIQNSIMELISLSHARALVQVSGGIFLLTSDMLNESELNLILSVSGIVLTEKDLEKFNLRGEHTEVTNERLDVGSGKLDIVKDSAETQASYVKLKATKPPYISSEKLAFKLPELFNGIGGFLEDEYIIHLHDELTTPLPWINVVANPKFGFIVTESGGGYTWCDNSRENKLTPWQNDFAASDILGESIYIRDDETLSMWTPTPLPLRDKESYIIAHGFGYTNFRHLRDGIQSSLTMFVPISEPVKLYLLQLDNTGSEHRELTLTYYNSPVLGAMEHDSRKYINIGRNGDVLTAQNSYNQDFAGKTAFYGMSEKLYSYTADKDEFFGTSRGFTPPEALYTESLSDNIGSGYNACVAMQTKVKLPPKGKKTLVFFFGECDKPSEMLVISEKYSDPENAKAALTLAKGYWNKQLSAIKVKSPDESFNIMVNGRLLYQTLACRIWGRSAFYQSGGAYGFRDQLQDTLALLTIEPEIAREQIVRAAYHQFIEGDVQHWWHEKVVNITAGQLVIDGENTVKDNYDYLFNGPHRGIRTRFSDDLLWLPYVVCEYVAVTGDKTVLDITVPFMEDELLGDNEDERYAMPRVSAESADIFNHCVRAIERSLRFGEHGIPLMGSGDWNDGMSAVGNKGKGESVWLGWFLYDILQKFAVICDERGEWVYGVRYRATAETLSANLDSYAWDGEWYRRAYFDNGTPLGSSQNLECKIDAIAQSWSVISGAGKECDKAMDSALKHLVSFDDGIIKLLTPPFDSSDLQPGYIKGYLPGVRENGGQYTHAAAWVVLAFAKMGLGNTATELFSLINPINHARTPIETAIYKTEPYAVAADVYAMAPHVGRGGWTWYTGASGWLYRTAIEGILGITKRGNELYINPCLSDNWNGYELTYRYESARYDITVKNETIAVVDSNAPTVEITLDGKPVSGNSVPLVDDGKTHKVSCKLRSINNTNIRAV